MSSVMSAPVLVLNKGWTPITTISVQRAISMLFSEYEDGVPKAKIIDPTFATFTWEDWAKLRPVATDSVIRASNIVFKCPEVIMLTRYEKLPTPRIHFSRRTLYKRDGYRCQYCGDKPGTESLSIDHVVPRSKGGQTTWENCVLSCQTCNAKKADKTCDQCGMFPMTVPKKPKMNVFRIEASKRIESWDAFISECYWNTELQK